jgi:hypothetical protein
MLFMQLQSISTNIQKKRICHDELQNYIQLTINYVDRFDICRIDDESFVFIM